MSVFPSPNTFTFPFAIHSTQIFVACIVTHKYHKSKIHSFKRIIKENNGKIGTVNRILLHTFKNEKRKDSKAQKYFLYDIV